MALVNKLNVPHKIGRQAIIRAFCTVASIVVESKAGLESPSMYHNNQQLQRWLKWHTKLANYYFWKVLSAWNLASSCLILPLQKLAIKFRQLGDLSALEKFDTHT